MNTNLTVLLMFLVFVMPKAQASDDGEDLTMMSTPAPTVYSCSGLQLGQEDRMDDDEGDPLYQVPQVNDQESVTNGIGVKKDGKYFGSCATFTSVARVVTILKNENLPIPPDFQVTEENIKKFFKAYGDGNNKGKGKGNAQIVTANILQEYKAKYCKSTDLQLSQYLNLVNQAKLEPQVACLDSKLNNPNWCHPHMIDQYLADPDETKQLSQKLSVREFEISKNANGTDVTPQSLKRIFGAVSNEFLNRPRLPIEIIYGGNGLHNTFERGTPNEDNRRRKAHVSLITGRRLTKTGECQILIRNSYQTRCNPRTGKGKQMYTGRDCEGETDSTWFSESHLTRFIGAVRVTNPIHPAAPRLLAKDQKE